MSDTPHSSGTDRALGAVCFVCALVLLFVWIPIDTETGLIEKARRRLVIGDALAPTVAGVLFAVASLWLLVIGQLRRTGGSVSLSNIRFMLTFAALVGLSLFTMRWAGPVAVWLSGDTLDSYRFLRDTVPWKYIGYLLGGFLLVAGVMAWIERRVRLRSVLLAIAVVLAMALIYDLPFEDLLLPPNGDV